MSEIDPWALPQGGAGSAGIPGSAPAAPRLIQPLNRVLPKLVMGLGAAYVIACIVEIIIVNSQISLANQLNSAISSGTITDAQVNQANASDSHVTTGSWIAAGIFLASLISIVVWERKLKNDLGSVGARRAVLNKAGYVYFRATWLISFVLGLFLQGQVNSSNSINSVQELISHDHTLTIYFGLRALLGAVMIVFAFRLEKISEDGVARLRAQYSQFA